MFDIVDAAANTAALHTIFCLKTHRERIRILRRNKVRFSNFVLSVSALRRLIRMSSLVAAAVSRLRSLGSFVKCQRMRLRWNQRFTKLRDDESEKNSREKFQSDFRRRMFQWLFCPVFLLPLNSPIYIVSTFLLFNWSIFIFITAHLRVILSMCNCREPKTTEHYKKP